MFIEENADHIADSNTDPNTNADPNTNPNIDPNTDIFVSLLNQKYMIQLNESGTAYIIIQQLPNELKQLAYTEFDNMWNLHPPNKHKIILFEREYQLNRYSKSYLNTYNDLSHITHSSYMYSGYDTSTNNDDLPQVFDPFYQYMKNTDPKYNQVIANWYEKNTDFIAPHSDCTKGWVPDANVSILTFYPNLTSSIDDIAYIMDLIPKKGTKSTKQIHRIKLDHGMILTMCGTTQDEFKHGIKKGNADRISLSFRQMK